MTYLLLSSHVNSWWPCWPDAKRGYEGGAITTTMELISVLRGAENSAVTAFAVLPGWRKDTRKPNIKVCTSHLRLRPVEKLRVKIFV